MKFVEQKVLANMNEKRLRSVLKRARIERSLLFRRYTCDCCGCFLVPQDEIDYNKHIKPVEAYICIKNVYQFKIW